jgi:hypothetical protein
MCLVLVEEQGQETGEQAGGVSPFTDSTVMGFHSCISVLGDMKMCLADGDIVQIIGLYDGPALTSVHVVEITAAPSSSAFPTAYFPKGSSLNESSLSPISSVTFP